MRETLKKGDTVVVTKAGLLSEGCVGEVKEVFQGRVRIKVNGFNRWGELVVLPDTVYLQTSVRKVNPPKDSEKTPKDSESLPDTDICVMDYVTRRRSGSKEMLRVLEVEGCFCRVAPVTGSVSDSRVTHKDNLKFVKRPLIRPNDDVFGKYFLTEKGAAFKVLTPPSPRGHSAGSLTADVYVKAIDRYGSVYNVALRNIAKVTAHPLFQPTYFRASNSPLPAHALHTETTSKVQQKGLYYLFNPRFPKPPKVRHSTLQEAETAQKTMAEKNPGEEFYILKAVSVAKATKQYKPVTEFNKQDL